MGSNRIATSVDLSSFFQCWILSMGHIRVNTMVYLWIFKVVRCWFVWNAESSYEAAFIRTDRCTVWTLCTVQGHSVRLSVSYGSYNKHQILPYRIQHLLVSFVLHTHTVCSVWGRNWFFFFYFVTSPAQILGFRSPGRLHFVPWRLEFWIGF